MYDTIIHYICLPLGYLMQWSWQIIGNYGFAILLFTLATKVVLMPLSVWLQYNSIKMVKLQPDINFIKANHFGDADAIAEEQSKLFKREKYHPLASLIPLAIQLLLLMGVVEIIYHPMDYILHLDANTVSALAAWGDVDTSASGFQLEIVRLLRSAGSLPDVLSGVLSAGQFDSLVRMGAPFAGFDLTVIPSSAWGIFTVVPALAGISSWLLCWAQNVMNPLQAEQGKLNKYGVMALSVALSLCLGFFVPVGIVLYWIAANLLAILVQVILNLMVNPKKFIDYDALEKSRAALADLHALGQTKGKKTERDRENERRQREDYKKFFKVVNKHIVLYSERGGFYKYFEALISQLLARSNVSIHYVTNDPDDPIFEKAKTEPRIRPYYVGIKKLIPLMMKLDADIVMMTTPDLEKYYIKRSFLRKDAEYIYLPHDTMSTIMGFREGALDAFDTIFCAGPHIAREVRATEKVYGLPEKTLVEFGYPLIEKLIAAGDAERVKRESEPPRTVKEILIAPSWQEDNLMDSCLDSLLDQLVRPGYRVTVRPHPEYVKRYPEKLNAIIEKYRDRVGENLSFELDFTVNRSVYASDLLVTDWSGISVEFCFATKRPALFINTKMKAPNPNWQKTGLTPVEISLRNEIGIALDKSDLGRAGETVADLLARSDEYREKITEVLSGFLYHIGDGGETGAMYILRRLKQIQEQKKLSDK